MAIGVIFLGLTIVMWGFVDLKHRIDAKKRKKAIRQRAYEALMRKKARQDALRKQKEDEAWASYVFETNEEFRNEFGDDRQTG